MGLAPDAAGSEADHGSNGECTNGECTNGECTNGERTNGERTNGEVRRNAFRYVSGDGGHNRKGRQAARDLQ
ncbi:hypothetical protein [Streptomyces decoyicus]|uniref:hypothetical protein n=1 Tax=Streptomyces decoyicus TaxID=249567 RepID=UPI003827552C